MSSFNEVNPVKGILCSGHVIKYLFVVAVISECFQHS